MTLMMLADARMHSLAAYSASNVRGIGWSLSKSVDDHGSDPPSLEALVDAKIATRGQFFIVGDPMWETHSPDELTGYASAV